MKLPIVYLGLGCLSKTGKYCPTEGRARSLIHSHEGTWVTPNPNAKQSRQIAGDTEGGTFQKGISK